MSRTTRLILAASLFIAPTALPGVFSPAAAIAQPQRVEAYVVVVTATGVPLRCGDSTLYYPVAEVKAGDTLFVDGETTGWLRVQYPAGIEAFVPASELTGVKDGVAKLGMPSKLKAPNAKGGVRASFFQLFEQDLPAGTELKVLRPERSDDGAITHYAVTPPAGARAWISRDAVRRATPDEATKALTAKGETAPPPAPTVVTASTPTPSPAPVVPAPAPTATPTTSPTPVAATTPSTTPAATPASAPASAAAPASSTSAALALPPTTMNAMPAPAPTATPTAAPTPSVSPTPAPAPAVTEISTTTPAPVGTPVPMTRPVADEGKDGPFEPAPAPRTSTSTTVRTTTTTGALVPGSGTVENLRLNLNQIAETFNRINRQPLATAEFETAIAQIDGFRATLGGSPRDVKLNAALKGYSDALRLRMELRDNKRAGQTAIKEGTLQGSALGQRVVDLERQRVYNIIGRLVRSTVYDGDRVPLLYRVMSPEPGAARTLGYLLPNDKFDLVNKLEQVVGIIGEVRPEESLRTNLIIPTRVDVVSLAPIVVSPDIPGVVIPRAEPAARPALPAGVSPGMPPVAPGTAPTGQPEQAPEPEKP